jgi:hypothetical protein
MLLFQELKAKSLNRDFLFALENGTILHPSRRFGTLETSCHWGTLLKICHLPPAQPKIAIVADFATPLFAQLGRSVYRGGVSLERAFF